MAGAFREVTGLSAGALNADLVSATDVSGYKSFSIQITGTWTGTLTIQGSNDNSTWYPASWLNTNDIAANAGSTADGNAIKIGPINYRYLKVRMTAYTSGTATGVLELYTSTPNFQSLGVTSFQGGTWTVQPGNTVNTSPWLVRDGGTSTAAIAAGTFANTVIKASAGTLARILVTATGTNAMNFYDNASTNSGTIIGALPASPAVGTVLYLNMPAANGITSGGNASNPGVTVSYV